MLRLFPKPVETAPATSPGLVLIWIGIPFAWVTLLCFLMYHAFTM